MLVKTGQVSEVTRVAEPPRFWRLRLLVPLISEGSGSSECRLIVNLISEGSAGWLQIFKQFNFSLYQLN